MCEQVSDLTRRERASACARERTDGGSGADNR